WQQTQFFVGDVNVTMPNGGTPFFFPTLLFWNRADVAAALMPVDRNAPGLAIAMDPMRPGSSWVRVIEGSGSGGGLVGKPSTNIAPPIETLRNASHAGLFVSGPLSPRVGLAAAVDWSGSSQFERNAAAQPDGQAASVFSNLVFRQNDRNELRLVGWVQRTQSPLLEATLTGASIADQTTFGHLQATWEHQGSARLQPSVRVFAAYSDAEGSRDHQLPAAFAAERLLVGPVPTLVDSGDQTSRQWTAGVRWASAPRERGHMLQAGADVTGATTRSGPGYSGSITELVDGKAARMWQYSSSGVEPHRHATFANAFVGDRIGFGAGRSADLSVAYDGAFGSADGATTGISWNSVLPRLSLRWKQGADSHFTWLAAYRRAADRLTLDTLAVGDPAAPTAAVVAPSTVPGRLPAIVMRVGPGTGGDPNFSAIDPSLARPTTDEVAVGIEAQLTKNVRGRITAVGKEVRHLYDLADIGAPLSSYSLFTVTDGRPAADGGDVQLPVYNRLPATFAADRYLLTTRAGDDTAKGAALVLNSEANLKRLTLMFNATASITDGPGESRGFRVDENNLGALGEASIDPNAATDARGRLFYDRAFTLKLSGVYRFGGGVTLGVIARYQDGQPFSRLTLVPGSTTTQQPNQGIELIRAYEAGDARFMYTGTLDVRLQKQMTFGATALDLFVDAYNLPNMGNEVEERIVTGPGFRDITAIQPPVSVHIGARIHF
ncbi:MAG TPA: hypothetical protein VN628_18660, partial [Vicinamibacterales bacterium]|nr:hypothetical protein [Vicinamibacterales bacterium]